ncbi:MAG: hypothetical protein IKW97_05385 [Muribaculaceae bacterium]|nr:hypothetical protein [Muribaculaceae bacterium]
MKKIFTLFVMVVMLAFTSQAAYYIVGNTPFGNWDPGNGVEMTMNTDGSYSYTATISGSVWFVFSSGLDSNWDVFNAEYRYGPASGADEEVQAGAWITTQKQGNGNGAYKFTGSGSEYVFTFNPYINKFKIDGYVVPITIETYTAAGVPTSIFGTEWDNANTDNDMIEQEDGTFKLQKFGCELGEGTEIAFKIVGNHDWGNAWPSDNFVYTVEQSGIYDVTITFNPETKLPNIELVQSGSISVLTGDLFILGEVNGNGWDPSNGVKMDTEDGKVFTGNITTTGANIDEADGNGYSYFAFTSKLGENADDWAGIAAYRIGATENDFLLSPDLYGIELPLSNFGQTNSFKIPAGVYDLTVDVVNKIIIVNMTETPPEPPVEGFKIEKVWEIADLPSFIPTADARQGFGMGGKFYINNKADQKVIVVDENGLTNTEYPGGANCGITRDEAGNIVVSTAAFPDPWNEATIKVINPETNEMKEYTVPEECGIAGRCDFLGFAKGNLMENGFIYLTGATNSGVSVLSIGGDGGEVIVDECYPAPCDGLSPTSSTVINYYKDANGEDALLYVTRNAAPLKLMLDDGDSFVATNIAVPAKGACNGMFPFIWEGKEYFIYPQEPNYQDGFAIAEAGAEEPIVVVPSTVTGNANAYQANWLNAEVDEDGVNIYQYYPGGHLTVYRLTNGSGNVEELINDVNKVVAGVRYYNIMGQEMKEANGITIVVTTYTDGSHSAVKIIK